MAKLNTRSLAGRTLITAAILQAAFDQETDPAKKEGIKDLLDQLPQEKPRTTTKCLLPSCRGLTNHNGGYCSPACCKEHRAIPEVKV